MENKEFAYLEARFEGRLEDRCDHCGALVPVTELTQIVDDYDGELTELCIACTEDRFGGCGYGYEG